MPLPSFLSSVASKAQNAINQSPLAAHLPSGLGPRPSSPDSAAQPPANEAAAQGSKSHTFENISYQFRSFQQQYSTTSPAQRIVTASKGVALDLDNLARDTKAQSKELYTWGQDEAEDMKDVTDRLAYLNFVHGSLASSLAQKLNTARNPFKELRNAESAIQPRRIARAQLVAQIQKFENDPRRAGDLREQLQRADAEDAQAEKEIEILKRKAVRESEQQKWEAIREYAEKLVLLSKAATPMVAALPTLPPDSARPYTGGSATAAARAALQRALDNYKTGHINLQLGGGELRRSDTLSFGESHAAELSKIAPYTPAHHAQAPPLSGMPVAQVPQAQSPPIDASILNQSPAMIPPAPHSPPVSPPVASTVPKTEASSPIISMPTVAETGIPVGGAPGPARGSLHDLKHASTQSGALQYTPPSQFPVPTHESAEDEKRRLAVTQTTQAPPVSVQQPHAAAPTQRHESAEDEKRRLAAMWAAPAHPAASQAPHAPTPIAEASNPTATKAESAEEEKKRLEREERERILRGEPPARKSTDEDLPPYQEPTLQ